MKKIITTTLLLMITFISNLSATTFTFNGVGNWNDSTKWSPSFPKNTPIQSYTSIEDSIIINGNCTIQSTDIIDIRFSLTYIVNGTLVNNGEINFLGHFYISNSGNITNNNSILGLTSIGADDITWNNIFINYGNLTNNNIILIDGIELPTFENKGIFYNNNYLECVGIVNNYGKLISNKSKIYSAGHHFYNYDTIIGSIYTGSLANYGLLSPGFTQFNTDTFFCEIYGIANYGTIDMEINSSIDYDVILLDYGNYLSEFAGLNVIFNPNFTPSITDTFTLVYALNAGPSPFKMARNNMTIQAPPVGFIWKVIYETQAMKLTLVPSTALPYENITFKAIQKANQVELNWDVTSIENVATFEIERADINNQFSVIGKVHSSEKLDYSYLDTKPNVGINQYRLRVNDIDGKYNYSEIIKIDFSTLKNEIINTLVEDNLYININAEESITIYNQSGQTVFNHFVKDGQTKISLSHLSKGIYFVKTENNIYKIIKL